MPYLESFDVCLIPFDTSTDLIKATNPVKFYEYLSAGKKIVATEIPELEAYREQYVYLENDPDKFCERVAECLEGRDTLAPAEDCAAFAKKNDWDNRTKVFMDTILEIHPQISIIVLCFNQLDYTKQCVKSILANTAYPNYELILVDNCSTDATAEWIKEIAQKHDNIKTVFNKTNRGFAGGNNDGISLSNGEYIVLLNNDTIVTRGWLTGLIKHYDSKNVGMVGPVTNSIGNEAKIQINYSNLLDMPKFAFDYTRQNMGKVYKHNGMLAMFCVMISREVLEKIGLLDENYGIGMFEDDDYSTAARKAGYDLIIAEDVFIHHFCNISFKELGDKKYMKIFQKNKKYFEKKWHLTWKKAHYRPGVLP